MADRENDPKRQEGRNRQRRQEQSPSKVPGGDADGAEILQSAAATASTSDPDMNWPDPPEPRPDQTASVQTSQRFGAASAESSLARCSEFQRRTDDVEDEQYDPRCDARRPGAGDETKSRGKTKEPDSQGLVSKEWVREHWKRSLLTGVFALICGMAGAWAYMHLSGGSKSKQQDGESKEVEKANQGGGETKSGGQSASQSAVSQSSGNQGGASESKTAGLHSPEGTDAITKDDWVDANLEHLAHRIDVLGKRLSKMTLPDQQSPAVLHALQMQVADLENDFEQVAALPPRMRQFEHDLSTLKEDVAALKQRGLGETAPGASERGATALPSLTPGRGEDSEPTTQADASPRDGDTP